MSFARSFAIALLFVGVPIFAADSAAGIKRFDQVDGHVYRGGQPTTAGFEFLARHGVQTIIDLREPGDRASAERVLVTSLGMNYVNVPMSGLTPPTESEITKILAILEDRTTGPVFVHCWRGADRTGAVIAAYHIDHDQWDNLRALKDAKAHGMSFFQWPRQNFIRSFRPRTVDAHLPSGSGSIATAVPAGVVPAAANGY